MSYLTDNPDNPSKLKKKREKEKQGKPAKRFEKIIKGTATFNRHIAYILGQRTYTRPVVYIDNTTKIEYAYITGAFQFAEIGSGNQSYLLIIGIPAEKEFITFQCLEEFLCDDELTFYRYLQAKQKEYRFIDTWWGDTTKLMGLHDRYNIQKKEQVIVSDFCDFHLKDRFQLYMIQLKTDVQSNNKVLNLNDCDILRNEMRGAMIDRKNPNLEDYPILSTAAGLVHTLEMYRPWGQAIVQEHLLPTKTDEMEAEFSDASVY